MAFWNLWASSDLITLVMVVLFIVLYWRLFTKKLKTKLPRAFLLAIWLFSGYLLVRALSYGFLDPILHQFAWGFGVGFAFCTIYWIEVLFYERPRLPILMWFLLVGGISLAESWMPANVEFVLVDGAPMALRYTGGWELSGIIFSFSSALYLCLFILYCGRRSMGQLKRAFYLVFYCNVIGMAFYASSEQLAALFALSLNGTEVLGLSVLRNIALFVVFFSLLGVIYRFPGILTLISYPLSRLLVINSGSGLAVFDHQWSASTTKDHLLAGLLWGIQSMSFDVIAMGSIEAVRMEEGYLLFARGNDVTVGIMARKSTPVLRAKIILFVQRFEALYAPPRPAEFGVTFTEVESAKKLVEEIFLIIPLQ